MIPLTATYFSELPKIKTQVTFFRGYNAKVPEEIITPAPLGSFGETDMNRNIPSASVTARE